MKARLFEHQMADFELRCDQALKTNTLQEIFNAMEDHLNVDETVLPHNLRIKYDRVMACLSKRIVSGPYE